MNNIKVFVHDSFDELSGMQQDWDEFIESIDGEIFLTYDWCRVWWKYYGHKRKLIIFTFRYQEHLCGILPLFLENIWFGPVFVRVIKMIGSDFLPVALSAPIKKEFLNEVVHCFINELANKYSFDSLHIGPICGRYESFDILEKSFSEVIKGTHTIKLKISDVQTYFKVADTWDKQLINLSHNEKRNMNKHYDRILRKGIPIECTGATNENIEIIFDNFVKMHQSHWGEKGQAGHFVAWPDSVQFHREMSHVQLQRKRLRLYSINVNGHCIGYHYAYKFGNTYYLFLYSRTAGNAEKGEKYDFGRIDFAETIKQAIKEQVKLCDAMRGKYDYKLQLGGELLPIRNIYIYSNKMIAKCRIIAARVLATVIDICYNKIWRVRIAPHIGVKLGAFWRIWLRTNIFSYYK